jgi:cytochrome c oxidase subunit III
VSPVLHAPRERVRANGHRLPPPPPPRDDGDGPEGEPAPPRTGLDNAVLATLFLIGAETMLFAGLVFSFWIVRLAAPVWPPPLQPRLPVGVTAANTVVLLASSVAMVAGLRAMSAGRRASAVPRLGVAAALGILFVAVQGYEWIRLVGFGLTASSGAYGTTFYTLIGAHGLHVLGAVLWLSATLLLARRGRFADGRTAGLRACAMYWHFVVALWPVLYVSVYLL